MGEACVQIELLIAAAVALFVMAFLSGWRSRGPW